MWADQYKANASTNTKSSCSNKISLMDPNAAMMYFKGHNVNLYYGCEFQSRTSTYNSMTPGAPVSMIYVSCTFQCHSNFQVYFCVPEI